MLIVRAFAVLLLVAVCGLAGAGIASAKGGQPVFVSAPGGSNCGGQGRAYSTIADGVAAADAGGTVHVCPGVYHEDVVITKAVTLQGAHATVAPDATDGSPLSDAIGGNNAFTVLAAGVTIRGFTTEGATSDGIFVVGDHALIENNTSVDNVVNGIGLDGSSWSIVRNNTLHGNGGGIELANDPAAAVAAGQFPPGALAAFGSSGTATHDLVTGNLVTENPQACGIYLVDHNASPGAIDYASGIHDNVVSNNVVTNNAMQGWGAGILLAAEVPGGAVYDNTVSGNTIYGNGLAGVTVHSHSPDQDLNGNVITGNTIGANNLRGFLEPDDMQTTGVFIGSQSPLSITVAGNSISDDHYGIFAAGGHVSVLGVATNVFSNVTVPFATAPTFEGA